jgi:thiosulfate dehydrogenase
LLLALLTVGLYAGAIVIGLHVKDLSVLNWPYPDVHTRPMWQPPSRATIPNGPKGESIRLGERIFNDTPIYAAEHTGADISCDSCHAGHGTQPFASPMVGVPATFPQYNARAGHVISLKDRIQECFVRSENGKPLDYNGAEMTAVVDYITWLSQPAKENAPYVGRGLIKLPNLTPDPKHGAAIYATQCAGCHGANGEGRWPHPPLWGANAFNDGAGMNGIPKMAAFVKANMPMNRKGILTAQEAYDVAAYIHAQPRPTFNKEYAHF